MATPELIDLILDLAVEDLRQTSFVPFWQASIDVTPGEKIRSLFKESRMSESRIRRELEEAATRRVFKSFALTIEDGQRDSYGDMQGVAVKVQIKNDSEWSAVLRDAWDGAESPNAWFLSDNALRLLKWLQGPKNTGEFSPMNRIGSQARLRGSGSYSSLETYFKEISLKCPYQVSFEATARWGGDYKASITPKPDAPQGKEFKNPVFTGHLNSSDRDSVQAYGQMLEDGILGTDLDETGVFLLFDIRSRGSLVQSLPDVTEREDFGPYELKEFLSKVRLCRGLKVAASLDDEASEGWQLGAVLEDGWTWGRARDAIREQRGRLNPEVAYGLSPNAARILDWIADLHDHEFELEMTPCVESVSREQIGIEGLEYERNSGALLGLLIEEINEKTNYSLRLIPWKDRNWDHHRVHVRRKTDDDSDLVKQIQVRGLDKGVHLAEEEVRSALGKLWAGRWQVGGR